MLRPILFTATVLSLVIASAVVSRAETMIFVEDFEDEQGQPAFDPMFNHQFNEDCWGIHDYSHLYPENGAILELGLRTKDFISFELQPWQHVVYASVDTIVGHPPNMDEDYSIDFIGQEGTQKVFLTQTEGFQSFGMSSETIGHITGIRIHSSMMECFFDNVAIHVIPEPSSLLLLTIGLSISAGIGGCARR